MKIGVDGENGTSLKNGNNDVDGNEMMMMMEMIKKRQ